MKTLGKISVAAGAVCALYVVVLAVIFGFAAGEIVIFTVGAALVACGVFYERMSRWWRRAVAVTAGAVAVFFAAMITIIATGARETATGTEDYLLVLGGGIEGGEVLPTPAARLDRALEYAARNPRAPIVVSGGRPPREAVSEAAAMKRYLAARGTAPIRVTEEGRSRNTRQNMLYTREILDSLSDGRLCTVACVTSRYHVMRARWLARRMGLDARMVCAPVPWYMVPPGYVREVLSVVKYWLEEI